MGNVLYEMNYRSPIDLIIPFLVFFCFLLIFIKEINPAKDSGSAVKANKGHRFQIIFLSFWLLILFVVCVLLIRRKIDIYQTVVIPYREGKYETVEGYVENFSPFPLDGRGIESFDIGDVHFEYDQNGSDPCYDASEGIIGSNGKYLRIRYIYYELDNRNLIMYIEELSP